MTMWVADHDDDRIYGYDMVSKVLVGTIDTLREEGNGSAKGIWSDGTTMWVADHDDDRIYAYRLSDGERVEDSESDDLLKDAGNQDVTGIWFDRTTMTMWAADHDDDLIYGYDMVSKSLIRTIDTLKKAGNEHAEGIWSDGTTMWVADHHDDRIYAYRLSDGEREREKEFDTPGAAGNGYMKGIWSDGATMWVADQDSHWIYAYNMPEITYPLGNPTNLAAAPGSQAGEVTLRWTAAANATVQWVYLVKPDGTDGRYWPHALAGDADGVTITGLDAGETYLFLVIAGQEQADGTTLWSQWSNRAKADAAMAMTGDDFARDAGQDFNGLASPEGIWSDGTTMWVAGRGAKIYAYNLVTKVRDSGKDFNGLSSSGNRNSESIWSDGTTMWAADVIDAKVYAYDMATKARVPRKDFDTLRAAGNGTPRGLWSDRVTLWVGDWRDGKIYAYDMATKARLPSNDFDTPGTVGNNVVEGLWSDGTTMWVTDHHDRKIYAYDMTTKARVVDKEFNTLASAGNQSPDGIWSDGITMWVADSDDGKLYAYKAPPSVQAQQFLGTPTGLSAAPGSEAGEVVLRWTPAANATVHWVYLQKADGTDGRYWETSLAGDANTAVITGLEVGQTYQFWVRAGQGQATGDPVVSEWSNLGEALPAGAVAPAPEGDRIVLHGGTLNGNHIDSTNPSLRVPPGQSISGTVDLSVTNHHGGHAIFPVGATTTWGPHQTSYWRLPIRPPAFGTSRQEVSINLTAPEQPGNYAIIFAAQAETSLGHVMSGTHWPSGGPRWDNGDDVAGWNTSQIDFAIAHGYVLAPQHGWGQPTARFGAAAVKIVVSGDASPSGTLDNPTGLTATPGSHAGEVVLRWTPAANATVHWIYLARADGADSRYWDTALAGDANTATITDLQAGETYRFWVQAGQAQADGTTQRSEWSNAVDAVAGGASMTASSAAPDLVVRSASVSGSNVAAGGSFTFSANVYNQGDGTSSATTLRYYRSTDSNVDVNDTEVSADGVTSLDPTDRSDESERLTAPSSAGTYYYGACVDPVGGESNTGNNCSSSVRVTVTAAAQGVPDLVVYSPSVYDKVFDPGERFDMSFWVQNQGDGGSTTDATLKYYRSSDATISTSDTELAIRTGTVGVGPIAASARRLVSIRLDAHTSGVYYYGVCVGNVPSESNTNNNCAAVFKVTLASPDLVVRSASVSDSNVAAGDSFTFSATVYNRGDATADSTTLRYYRSTNPTVTARDAEVSTDRVGSLDPAEVGGESERLTAPSVAGTYYYQACVDPVPNESDTTNNCSSVLSLTVQAAGQGGPDLEVYSPSVYDKVFDSGERFNMSFSVRNRGGAASTTTASLKYYRSSDANINPSDTEIIIQTGITGVGPIAASGQSSVTIRLTAHTSGVYYYGVCVGSVPGESNTNNNCAAVFRVTLASPDLVVRSASVSDSSVEAGDRFTFSATVYNQGNGAADSTTLRYYRSTDSTVNTNDTEVDTDPVRSLDPAEDGDESERLTAPSSAGTYYYGACVDSVDGESNTRNNCSTSVMVTVTSGEEEAPDMVADPPSFNDYNPEQGTSIMLTFSARNQGDATAPATTLRVYYSIYSDFRHEIEVENFAIPSLRASRSFRNTLLNYNAPNWVSTFYYRACVDAVSGESDTQNNCSEASVLTTRERSP